jgi:putative ABC transport system permease protein
MGRAFLDQTIRDLYLGARMLLKTPVFTIVAVLILAMGIGVNVTVFRYVNGIFLRTPDVPNPERLVKVSDCCEGYSGYLRYRSGNQTFEELAAYYRAREAPIRMPGASVPLDIVSPIAITGNLFKAIGVNPLQGRAIESEDEKIGSPDVVMLNEQALQKYFPAETDVLGKTLFVNNVLHTVVGIAPKSFQSVLEVIPLEASPHIYVPRKTPSNLRYENAGPFSGRIGRLKRGISLSEAETDLSRIGAQMSVESRRPFLLRVYLANRLSPQMGSQLKGMIAIFMIILFVILLIACDDIAILQLARVAARRRELAIRVALGASRGQLIRQLLVENLLLSLLGGAGAMVFVFAATRILNSLPFPLPMPDSTRLTFDWRVILFASAMSIATTLFFGLQPALHSTKRDLVASMTMGVSPARSRVHSNLVITQIAVCTVLLVIAGALVVSQKVGSPANLGFSADNVLIGRVNFSGSEYDSEAELAFHRRFLNRIGALPGIASVSLGDFLPMVGNSKVPEYTVRRDREKEDMRVSVVAVSRAHFETLQIPLSRGRDFLEGDDSNAVGIVNEALAQRLWGNENPVGRSLIGSDNRDIRVIGVVGNVKYRSEDSALRPVLYRPLTPQPGAYRFLIRPSGRTTSVAAAVSKEIAASDPRLFAEQVGAMEDRVREENLPFLLLAYASAIPGGVALILGIIGTYGSMAILVSERRREVGIRIALGARPGQATRVVTQEGARMVGIGLGLGIFGAFVIALALSRVYYGPNFFSLAAFIAVPLLIAAAAVAACYVPFRNVRRVDPMVVLRVD